MKRLYMKVTNDEYELPVAVADSSKELAEMVGTTRNAILSAISHGKTDKYKRVYIKVEFEDEEEDF